MNNKSVTSEATTPLIAQTLSLNIDHKFKAFPLYTFSQSTCTYFDILFTSRCFECEEK